MVELLTLDSSILVAAVREVEEKHKICKELLQKIVEGKYQAIEPYSVLVEVVAAAKRRTSSPEFAERVKKDLLMIETITFEELVKFRAEEACEIAKETGLKGMDAVVVQVAKENETSLVSLDEELVEKAKAIVEIKEVESLA